MKTSVCTPLLLALLLVCLAMPPVRAQTEAADDPRLAVEDLLVRGKAQYVAGEYAAARQTFAEASSWEPDNPEVRKFLTRLAQVELTGARQEKQLTKAEMLVEVARGWERPRVFSRETAATGDETDAGLREKLASIVIPKVVFNNVPLSKVIDTLSALSEEYDSASQGVNMVFINATGSDPIVNITLRQLTLNRILDFIVEAVGYEYDVQADAVVIRQGASQGTRLETDFFPINRSTIIRLTGIKEDTSSTDQADPFAAPVAAAAASDVPDEETALKNFLQRAGVNFDSIAGANLALADGQLIVTQTPRNLEKVRNILRRYSEIKQVEIEARFLEVQQGDLEELGFNWSVNTGGKPTFNTTTGDPIIDSTGEPVLDYQRALNSNNRSLNQAFSPASAAGSRLLISTPDKELTDPVAAPEFTRSLDLAANALTPFAKIGGVIGEFDVDLLVRALSRKSGNDLMSAPKITVLSGKTAEIVVAQELRYPESYSDIEAQVGKGDSGSGSAGVAITAGTPQDFTMRNIGVEMEVTPTVEDDNSISLRLEPKVTEFEGFVEYGGPSIAIASGSTVKVPSGFYQPIFSVRRVRTEVTIWDGATVVMGGLTREQSVSVKDKVPVVGDIPLLGRLFQSRGESSQKRNLLVFVTANMISPGGSPARQQIQSVEPGTMFQNPVIVTPGGEASRNSRKK